MSLPKSRQRRFFRKGGGGIFSRRRRRRGRGYIISMRFRPCDDAMRYILRRSTPVYKCTDDAATYEFSFHRGYRCTVLVSECETPNVGIWLNSSVEFLWNGFKRFVFLANWRKASRICEHRLYTFSFRSDNRLIILGGWILSNSSSLISSIVLFCWAIRARVEFL